jgi:hypothetical protein
MDGGRPAAIDIESGASEEMWVSGAPWRWSLLARVNALKSSRADQNQENQGKKIRARKLGKEPRIP